MNDKEKGIAIDEVMDALNEQADKHKIDTRYRGMIAKRIYHKPIPAIIQADGSNGPALQKLYDWFSAYPEAHQSWNAEVDKAFRELQPIPDSAVRIRLIGDVSVAVFHTSRLAKEDIFWHPKFNQAEFIQRLREAIQEDEQKKASRLDESVSPDEPESPQIIDEQGTTSALVAPEVTALKEASDKLDDWFPREEKQPEPRKSNRWQSFWTQAKDWGYTEDDVRRNVFKVDYMEETCLTPAQATMQLRKDYEARQKSQPANAIYDAPSKPPEATESVAPPPPAIPLPATPKQEAFEAKVTTEERPTETLALVPFDPSRAIEKVKASSDLMRAMRQTVLREGIDYGAIPGTEKKTLLKPGAEKLCSAFSLCPVFEDVDKVERWDADKPLFHYRVRCKLVDIATGAVVATGIGSCNSMESKYRQRWVFASDLKDLGMKPDDFKPNQKRERMSKKTGKPYTQYAIENADPFSLVNTIDKMAQKRALIAAVLIGTNASEYYTQDVETLQDYGYIDAEVVED